MTLKALSLLATVAVLLAMAWFMLASLPLLVLKHDNPMDARFIRSVFTLYYRLLTVGAWFGTVVYLLQGNLPFATGMLALALVAFTMQRRLLPRMDTVRWIMLGDVPLIREFRSLHIRGMALNAVQLVATVASLFALKL